MPLEISIPLFFIGVIIQIVDKLSERYKESIEKVPYLKTVLFWLSILIIIVGGIGTISSLLQTKKYEVYAAPGEIKLGHQRNKHFTLKITNNQNFAVFDVNLGICCNNKKIDLSSISLKPAKEDKIPGVPFSILRLDFCNACSAFVIRSINAHSTKEFFVRIQGDKVKNDSLISFLVYDWAHEPSLFEIPTTKHQFANPPKHFKDFFNKKSEKEQKTGRAFFQRLKLPKNPYFHN